MIVYKLDKPYTGAVHCVQRLSDNAFIPFDPANTDYQRFKSEINADEAELQDVDGNLMTSSDAKAFVATLP
jgi:hypothetical protein